MYSEKGTLSGFVDAELFEIAIFLFVLWLDLADFIRSIPELRRFVFLDIFIQINIPFSKRHA